MSLLGKLLRTHLAAQAGYAATIPGGISPESAPVDNPLPYVVYQGISRTRELYLAGTPATYTERVQFMIVAETRLQTQTVVDWIVSAVQASPSRLVVSGTTIHSVRVDDENDQAEFAADGTDELARITTVDVVGTY